MRAALLTATLVLVISTSASAQFQLDITSDDVNRHLGIRTVSDLAVNEHAYLNTFTTITCAQDERLFVVGQSELDEPSEFNINFLIRRKPGGSVQLRIENEMQNSRHASVVRLGETITRLAINRLGSPLPCEHFRFLRPQSRFFTVESVDGHDRLTDLVAFHRLSELVERDDRQRTTDAADRATTRTEPVPPEWADERYPDIDYTTSPFAAARIGRADAVGHWLVYEDTAELDDSPRITARTFGPSVHHGGESWFHLQCVENETRVLFSFKDALSAANRTNPVRVEFRIDDEPAQSERWQTSTTRTYVGLWRGARSENMIRALLGRQQLYIRVTDDRNRRRSDTFDIRGVDDVAERVAAACGWSTLALTNADYRQIQGLLQRAGHYAGAIDGDWGPQSRAAMRAFQEANGLAVTGAPDQDSLNLLNE